MFEKQPWMQRAGEFPQNDQEYFALLARAVFSAGLGPKVVESRWRQMTEAFHEFDPVQVTTMGEEDVARLLSDPGVIRNRRKIEAVIKNAGTFLDRVEEHRAVLSAVAGTSGTAVLAAADGAAGAGKRGRSRGTATTGRAAFHEYLLDMGAGADIDLAADGLAKVFTHLGRTSALFFLFSAGFRPSETGGLAAAANG
jgi:3-methyladenine DNA glycosylase Tag